MAVLKPDRLDMVKLGIRGSEAAALKAGRDFWKDAVLV
jgi:hypothetical protein